MKHDPPAPELGVRNGLACALFLPETEPTGGVVLLHGAGSGKESHYDFGRLCTPYGVSEALYGAAREPKRLLLFLGGHHRSLQHDLEVQNLAARFLTRAMQPRTA